MADRDTDASDVEFLRRSGSDAEAFGVLYDRHVGSLHAWCRARAGDAAADMTAEVFARAWLHRRRFRDEANGSAGPWLYGIAGNVYRDSLRRGRVEAAARRKLGVTGFADDPELERVDERLSVPADALAAVAALPDADRTALELRVGEEQSYDDDDVAAQLDTTPQAARSPCVARAPAPELRAEGGEMTDFPEQLTRYRGALVQAIDRKAARRRRANWVFVATGTAVVVAGLALGVTTPWHAGPSVLDRAAAAISAPGPGQILEERTVNQLHMRVNAGGPREPAADPPGGTRSRGVHQRGDRSRPGQGRGDDHGARAARAPDPDHVEVLERTGRPVLGRRRHLPPVRVALLAGVTDPFKVGFPVLSVALIADLYSMSFGPVNGPYSVVTDFAEYRYLPRTPANRKLADIRSMHPGVPIL